MLQIWNEKAVGKLMQNLSTAFPEAGPLEILLFLGIVAAIISFYVFYNRRKKTQMSHRRVEAAVRAFNRLSLKLELSPSEIELLKSLSFFLINPEEEIHFLLQKRETFDRVEPLYLEVHPDKAMELIAMRVRLGFSERAAGKIIHSTADLAPGIILLDHEDRPQMQITAVLPEHLVARPLANSGPASGHELELFFFRPDGKYMFSSTVVGNAPPLVHLQHSGDVHRIQEREHFRFHINLPVKLGSMYTNALNLSGGGACLHIRPGHSGQFIEDGNYELVTDFIPGHNLKIASQIVNIRESDGLIHLVFNKIRESERDQLIKCLMDRSREELTTEPEFESLA